MSELPPAAEQPEDRLERQPDDGPRVYVASLSDYNAGILHGVWLEATDTVEGLQEGIDSMLSTSPARRRFGEPAEEWAIHDYEGFGAYRLSEWEPLEKITALAVGIERYGQAFSVWASHDSSLEVDRYDRFEDAYQGVFSSAEDYGDQMLDEMGVNLDDLPGIPDGLAPYVKIDVEGWVRDMELGGDIWSEECEQGMYVFWSE